MTSSSLSGRGSRPPRRAAAAAAKTLRENTPDGADVPRSRRESSSRSAGSSDWIGTPPEERSPAKTTAVGRAKKKTVATPRSTSRRAARGRPPAKKRSRLDHDAIDEEEFRLESESDADSIDSEAGNESNSSGLGEVSSRDASVSVVDVGSEAVSKHRKKVGQKPTSKSPGRFKGVKTSADWQKNAPLQKLRTAGVTRGSRSDYAQHEQRPVYLPGVVGGGIVSASQPVASFDRVGVDRPPLRITCAPAEQDKLTVGHTIAWRRIRHFSEIHHYVRDTNSLVADWSWWPGKDVRLNNQGLMIDTDQHFSRRGQSSDGDTLQGSKGSSSSTQAGPISTSVDRPKIVRVDQRSCFEPPAATLEEQAPSTDSVSSVRDIRERSTLLDAAHGDLSVTYGSVPARDGQMPLVRIDARSATFTDRLGSFSEGLVYNAGSFVASVDWAPFPTHSPAHPEYLAVALDISSSPGTVPASTLGQPSDRPGCVDILSLVGGKVRMEYRVCVPQGQVMEARWMPCGWDTFESVEHPASLPSQDNPHSGRRIGILACRLSSRKIALYAVPLPEDVLAQPEYATGRPSQDGQRQKPRNTEVPYIELGSMLDFDLQSNARQPTAMAWGGSDLLAVGCANGTASIWPVGYLLRQLAGRKHQEQQASKRFATAPCHSFALCDTSITALSFLMMPPRSTKAGDFIAEDESGGYEHDEQPHYLLASCVSGQQKIVDLWSGGGSGVDGAGEVTRQREPFYASCFMPYLGVFVSERGGDNSVRLIHTRPEVYGRSMTVGQHHGRCTTLDASPFHPLIVSGGADGSVKIINVLSSVTKGMGCAPWNVYRLDIHRTSGRLRMVDGMAKEAVTKSSPDDFIERVLAGGEADAKMPRVTGWHPVIRITDVRWCPNIQGAFLLASSTAAGLVRLDWIAPSLKQGQDAA